MQHEGAVRCLVSTFGSAGDFPPGLAIGAALRRHDVHFVGNPFYESGVRNAGLEFVAAGDHYDLYELLEKTPAYMDPRNFGMLLRELAVPGFEAPYRVIREVLGSERFDVVVTGELCFGAIWAAAERAVPSVLVHASPVMWMSWQAPAVFGDRTLPRFVARPLTVAVRAPSRPRPRR